MEILLLCLVSAAAGAGVVLYLRARRPAGSETEPLREVVRLMADRLEGIDARLSETQSSNAALARNIFDGLADVRRATTTVAEQAREFTALGDLLRAPGARGGLGEAMLEELLRQVLPPQAYSTQHRFRTGAVVDAVVRAGGKLVCIDSKFPLANFRRLCNASADAERASARRAFAADIERHIKDIAVRYILPDENTFDFAVMYVPAEGVYAELLRSSHRGTPLLELAMDARVVPMSPLTMYGYLQTVLYGLKCLRIEASAQEILDYCGRLQGDIERFATEFEIVGRHLTNARTKYNEAERKLDRFRDKLDRVVDFEDDARPSLEAVPERHG
jgi:DNA recombination protein RmuC